MELPVKVTEVNESKVIGFQRVNDAFVYVEDKYPPSVKIIHNVRWPDPLRPDWIVYSNNQDILVIIEVPREMNNGKENM